MVVVVAVATVTALPTAARLLPAGNSSVSASDLLQRIDGSRAVAYSGYAQSQGGLGLPVVASEFSGLDDLFGGTTRLRVWWRDAQDWRVDSLGVTGEQDLYRDRGGLWQWDYEADTASRVPGRDAAAVRLPRVDDVLPPALAQRLLSEAAPADVTRLPGRRVAGEETAGLRLTVTDRRSTIRHVDVWALPDSGLPVQVEVYGAARQPVITSRFLDLTVARPDAPATTFRRADSVFVQSTTYPDLARVIDLFGDSTPPDQVAGLPRRTDLRLGAIGVYGRGVTFVVAVPLSPRLAGDVVPALRGAPGAVENTSGLRAAVGPLSVQLSPSSGYGSRWLLAGTVTARSLVDAVGSLPPVEGYGR